MVSVFSSIVAQTIGPLRIRSISRDLPVEWLVSRAVSKILRLKLSHVISQCSNRIESGAFGTLNGSARRGPWNWANVGRRNPNPFRGGGGAARAVRADLCLDCSPRTTMRYGIAMSRNSPNLLRSTRHGVVRPAHEPEALSTQIRPCGAPCANHGVLHGCR